jgi:hypothetical protein
LKAKLNLINSKIAAIYTLVYHALRAKNLEKIRLMHGISLH